MKFAEQNRLELIFVVLVTEQYWSATSVLLSNQNHVNAFKIISVKIIHEEIFLNFFQTGNMYAYTKISVS